MKIAVVGAGISGLATAKVLASYAHEVTIFEQRTALGGVWERSRHYAGLKIQSPREIYVFSDFPMPATYPEFPSAEQIVRYLEAYAEAFDLNRLIRFGARVVAMRVRDDGQDGVRLEWTEGESEGARADDFDHVVICNGLFSKPVMVELAGRQEFEAAGGRVIHAGAFDRSDLALNKTVAVVGFGKSALDIAYEALGQANSVTLVCRRTVWHLPYRLFGIVPVKSFSYSRFAEFWFGRQTRGFEGFVHKRARYVVRLYWAMTELILGAHLGLLRQRFRPPFPLRGAIGLSTGAGFADNLRALRDGRIGLAKGVIASLSADGLVLDGGERVAADLVVLATGYAYDLSILSPATLAQIVAPDGDFRLYRNIVNPGNPGITFNGYNATTAVPVTSEVAAHWIAGWLDGRVVRPDAPTMEARIDEDLHWRRANFPGGKQFGHFVAPLTFGYLDTLLADLGLPTADASRSQLVRFNAMLNPKDYAFLNGVQGPRPRNAR